MFLYNLRIAVKSLRRNPVLTTLLIGAIALGICVATTFIALRHIMEKDPLPGKSDTLFYVRMDNWDPQRAYVAEDPKSLPTQITYRDMRGLMASNIPTRQTGTFRTRFFIHPDPKSDGRTRKTSGSSSAISSPCSMSRSSTAGRGTRPSTPSRSR
jgi:putative ABC transport system permease protein